MKRFLWLPAAGAVVGLLLAETVRAQPSPYPPTDMPPSPIFPADNWWNADVSAVSSDAAETLNFKNFFGAGNPGIHPDFGGVVDPLDPTNPGVYGMVYYTVPGTQARVTVVFPDPDLDSESDHGWPGVPNGYPIPAGAITQPHWIEGGFPGNQDQGEDQHMLIVDRDHRLLYELWQTHYNTGAARWEAGSGAIFPLESDWRRPEGWTSGDAAGLAILPGLVRYDEAYGTQPIRHAFRFTLGNTKAAHVFPASHTACNAPCPTANGLPMGARIRLKSTVNPTFPAGTAQADKDAVNRIVQAMKTYGMILADNGSNMYVQGAFDARWDNDILNPALGQIHASDFEVLPLGWKPAEPAPSGATDFYTLAPCRLLDTRNAAGVAGGPKLTAGVARDVSLLGRCGLPSTAKALSLNLTVVTPTANGALTIYPGNFSTATNTTALSFATGKTRANNSVIAVSTSGTGTLALLSSVSGLDVVIDVNGYFQ